MKSERVMLGGLLVAALDSAYLSWRYIALRLAIVTPGTSICSWNAFIDCDRVLLTPEANAFWVPNGLLGFAFYTGCFLWWYGGKRLGPAYRFHIVRTLTFWLGVASLFTLRFFWLLLHLPVFCPLCPLNHFATYVAFGACAATYARAARPSERTSALRLTALVLTCVLYFAAIQWLWFATAREGMLRLPR